MGCGSSQEAGQHSTTNGEVKRAANSPAQNRPSPEPQRQKRPEKKRKSSGKSSESSSSSSCSSKSKRSNSSCSKMSGPRPETAPGQESNGEPAAKQSAKPDNINENNNKINGQTEGENAEVTEKPNFSEDVLKGFLDLENEIRDLQRTDPENMYRTKHATLTEMYKAFIMQKDRLERLKQQTAKEYQDVVQIANPSVRAMFANQMQLDAQVAKEQQEYLDALNRQEVAQDELDTTKEQYKRLYKEVDEALKATQALYTKRIKQEDLLGKIFNECYGSDQEWKLELELDMLAERRERMRTANYKWSNAQTFLRTAAGQISWSARRWTQIATVQGPNTMVKYQMVAETRNHLIAASQNLSTGIGFLAPIKPPYCTEQDLKTLNTAIGTIFNDVNMPALYQQAYNRYEDIYNKSKHVSEWVGMVIKDTIAKDLESIKAQYHEQYYKLKQERYTLIQAKIKEALGVDIKIEIKKEELPEDKEDGGQSAGAVATPTVVVKEEGEEQAPEAQETGALPASPPAGAEPPTAAPSAESAAPGGEAAAPKGGEVASSEAAPAVVAVALSELAPPPSHDDLFGDIEQLKKKHEEELAEFEKTQNMNRARVEQGLQEKLQARRSRKRKVQVQEAEAQMLTDTLPPGDAV